MPRRLPLLAALAACTGAPDPAEAPGLPPAEVPVTPTAPEAPPPTPPAAAADTDDTDTPASVAPPLQPAFVTIQATFALDAEQRVLRPFTLDGREVPVALDLIVFQAAADGAPAPSPCGLSLRPRGPVTDVGTHRELPEPARGPAPHVGLRLDPLGFDVVDAPVPEAGITGCLAEAAVRGWATSPWGPDPIATIRQARWGVFVGPWPDDKVDTLHTAEAYRAGRVTGASLLAPAGSLPLAQATGRAVDAGFAVRTDPSGEAVPLDRAAMTADDDGLPATGAYRVFDKRQVIPAEALLAP